MSDLRPINTSHILRNVANDGGIGGDHGSGEPDRFPGDRPRDETFYPSDANFIFTLHFIAKKS